MKVILSTAIMVDGDMVNELELKEPRFGDIVDMSAKVPYRDDNDIRVTLYRDPSEAEQTLALIASVAGITKQETRRLAMDDVVKITEALSPFLPGLVKI